MKADATIITDPGLGREPNFRPAMIAQRAHEFCTTFAQEPEIVSPFGQLFPRLSPRPIDRGAQVQWYWERLANYGRIGSRVRAVLESVCSEFNLSSGFGPDKWPEKPWAVVMSKSDYYWSQEMPFHLLFVATTVEDTYEWTTIDGYDFLRVFRRTPVNQYNMMGGFPIFGGMSLVSPWEVVTVPVNFECTGTTVSNFLLRLGISPGVDDSAPLPASSAEPPIIQQMATVPAHMSVANMSTEMTEFLRRVAVTTHGVLSVVRRVIETQAKVSLSHRDSTTEMVNWTAEWRASGETVIWTYSCGIGFYLWDAIVKMVHPTASVSKTEPGHQRTTRIPLPLPTITESMLMVSDTEAQANVGRGAGVSFPLEDRRSIGRAQQRAVPYIQGSMAMNKRYVNLLQEMIQRDATSEYADLHVAAIMLAYADRDPLALYPGAIPEIARSLDGSLDGLEVCFVGTGVPDPRSVMLLKECGVPMVSSKPGVDSATALTLAVGYWAENRSKRDPNATSLLRKAFGGLGIHPAWFEAIFVHLDMLLACGIDANERLMQFNDNIKAGIEIAANQTARNVIAVIISQGYCYVTSRVVGLEGFPHDVLSFRSKRYGALLAGPSIVVPPRATATLDNLRLTLQAAGQEPMIPDRNFITSCRPQDGPITSTEMESIARTQMAMSTRTYEQARTHFTMHGKLGSDFFSSDTEANRRLFEEFATRLAIEFVQTQVRRDALGRVMQVRWSNKTTVVDSMSPIDALGVSEENMDRALEAMQLMLAMRAADNADDGQ